MPEITGSLSRDVTVKGVCCWCGTNSTSSGLAPGLGVEIPLHLLCAAVLIRVYSRFLETGIPPPALIAYLNRLREIPRIGPGVG